MNFFVQSIIDEMPVSKQKLLMTFFIAFSRYEFALKAANFNRISDPNWDIFVNRIRNDFESILSNEGNEELKTAFTYFTNTPPLKWKFDNGNWRWVSRERGTLHEINFVCLGIRDLRNNLFHGSKFHNNTTGVFTDRDIELIKNALIILDCWLNLPSSINVKTEFERPLPAQQVI